MKLHDLAPICLLLFAGPGLAHAQTAGATGLDNTQVKQGRELYNAFGCFECHGHFGQGGVAGKKLAPGPLPYALFSQLVRKPAGEMPPYSKDVLTDQQLAAIHVYLRSIGSGTPDNARALPH